MTRPKPDQETRPAPPGAIVGVLGRGDYGRLRPRLRHLVRRLRVGTVVGQTINDKLTQAFALELGAEFGTVLEHWKVIDEATHLIFLGHWAPEIVDTARDRGKPVRLLVRERFPPPPGGWPKRPPKGPPLRWEDVEALDAEIMADPVFPPAAPAIWRPEDWPRRRSPGRA
ncbi:MAG TPA: hypothetical protein VFA75_09025 [Nevskia sp.]|nr:hypothetical protein [Nevskia sp.]